MEIIKGLKEKKKVPALCLGNFDGLHLGHLHLIKRAKEENERVYVSIFEPHPKVYFLRNQNFLLTTYPEKVYLFRNLVDGVVLFEFDSRLAEMRKEEFVEALLEYHSPSKIYVGENFRFGKNRDGDVKYLVSAAGEHRVKVVGLLKLGGERVRSSAIREFLYEGNLEDAKKMLGRPYSFLGFKVKGKGLGREVGYPTVNLEVPPEKLMPKNGVYLFKSDKGEIGVGIAGISPTFGGKTRAEVHFLTPFEERGEFFMTFEKRLGDLNVYNSKVDLARGIGEIVKKTKEEVVINGAQ